jgi:peptidoglycan-associated lipoprotein
MFAGIGRNNPARRAGLGARRVLRFLCSGLLLFVTGCGSSYSVATSEQRLPITPKSRTEAELERGLAVSARAEGSLGSAAGAAQQPQAAGQETDGAGNASAPGEDSASSARNAQNARPGWTLAEKQAATFIHAAPIFFYYDSAALTEQARQVLGQKAEKIRGFPMFKVIIAGHCDERGTEAYNYALGGRRAQAALDYLVGLGIPREQLDSVSYGKSNPMVSGRNEEEMSRNRRDDFHVSKMEKP